MQADKNSVGKGDGMVKTIVCYGDSNTHGYCRGGTARFDETRRWPCLLQELLGKDYKICEEGLSGRTTVLDDPLCEGLNGLSMLFPCLMTHEPLDLLILMLGTNDLKERFHMTAGNIAKGVEVLVQKAKQMPVWRGIEHILIVAPAPIGEEYQQTAVAEEMGRGCAEKSRRLVIFLEETARQTGCGFFDAGKISGLQMQTEDYMHLDENSHRLLAEALARYIDEWSIWD